MDIVIAAAGKGTRLGEYTQTLPKHIIDVAGRPFLYYLLDAAVAAQFRRIIVVGGYQFEKLQVVLQAYHSEAEIIVVNQFEKLGEDRYGTACPLLAAKSLIQGDRFVYTMGDHLVSTPDLELMQMSTTEMLVAATESAHPEHYGVIQEEADHQLISIVEKPDQPSSQSINVGLYTFAPDIFPVLERLPSSQRGEFEITDAVNTLAKRGAVRVVRLTGPWLDLSKPEDIAALEQFIQSA